ncbi:TPA: hypothetical protein N0F65_005221 [Lagenidium giganteum]|uniref:Stress-associated endoplasmic reticulum protein n=1 Tax=Lagenidium giganteum TaxID=4803 RepID=A0AAV2YQ58_9STRA|nr:TPA: hypothetical protein N0F65_005221 [Lagenidium giganteum]
MELRSRAGQQKRDNGGAGLRDVSLGPTIYAGERYGKMSERMKRMQKRALDADAADKLLTPRLVGFGLAVGMLLVIFVWIQFKVSARRNRD